MDYRYSNDFRFVPPPPGPPLGSPLPGMPGPPPGPTAVDYANSVRRLLDNLDASVGRLMRERDGFRETSARAIQTSADAIRQRDEARAEIARARSATVDALNNAQDVRDRAARSDLYRSWWTEASDRANKAAAESKRLAEVVERQQSAVRDAEAKTVDIGWRKNRLIDAITAKGFVVEWAKDGTPTLLTKEEAAKREAEAKAQPTLLDSYWKAMGFVPGNGFFDDYLRKLMDPPIMKLIESPYVPKDKVLFWGNNAVAAPGVISNLKVEYKPEDRVISQQPAKPAERSAEDYHKAAVRKVYGYLVATDRLPQAPDYMRERMDEALKVELKRHPEHDSAVPCKDVCGNAACKVYRERPWQK